MKKSRRDFVKKSVIGTTGFLMGADGLKASNTNSTLSYKSQISGKTDITSRDMNIWQPGSHIIKPVQGGGPATSYVPKIMAAIVRREGNYGMWWPGEIYDGEAAIGKYTAQIKETAALLGMELNLRPDPIFDNDAADAWIAEVKSRKPDGTILLVLDRQQHCWPTAYKLADTGIPSVIFAPLGSAFHSNTARLAEKPGCIVYSTTLDDSWQLSYGMKMLEAGAKIRHSRCILIKGKNRDETSMGDLGINVVQLPLQAYIDEVNKIPSDPAVLSMAEDLIRRATLKNGPTDEDVINGVKGYFAARKILEQEKGDSITLAGCVDLVKYRPCIAWVTLSDEGIPAACEGDMDAIASQTIIQYLFNRPGFQQDPVPDTANRAFIGAHCQCPTRLNGFDQPPEPFRLSHHHGNTDATIVPEWQEGRRITAIDVITGKEKQTSIHLFTGTVMNNISVPPNGGCVVSVRYRIDGLEKSSDVLSVPGMHQVFFYGDYGREIEDFCKLYNFKLLKYNS